MKAKYLFYIAMAVAIAASSSLTQEIPQLIYYQGNLADASGNPVNGNQTMKFSIWSSQTGGSELWQETHSAVSVNQGLFSVILGSQNQIPLEVFSDKTRYLEIEIGGETLSPRQQIASMPYAYTASSVSGTSNVFPDTGNVGIGTSFPGVKLDVIGNNIRLRAPTTGISILKTIGLTSSGELCTYQQPLTINSSEGFKNNVGIGTKSPAAKLDVSGSVKMDGFKMSTGASNGFVLTSDELGTGTWQPASDAADNDWTISGNFMYAAVSGHVGIGTPTPNYKLHVIGDLQGGCFEANGTGVEGRTSGANSWGVYGAATDEGDFTNSGGCFIAHSKKGIGVIGEAQNSGDVKNYGGRFTASGTRGIGVYAQGGSEGYAGEFDGAVQCTVLEITGGSDMAESFDVEETGVIKPGMVLVIDPESSGKLKISQKAYDRCVAGIVSGAGDIETGVVMGQSGSVADGEYPVALSGRVYCRADASNGVIEPGDLLTTSDTPGYAMKVMDYARAQGAVIGKAMGSLKQGQGMVLVLVTLQ